MKITRAQIRNIIRESLNEQGNVGATAELTQSPDRAAVAAAWPNGVTYEGENVFEKFYKSPRIGVVDAEQWIRDEGYDGQEVYLGYDPQSDKFVMGFDAFYEEDGMGAEMEAVVVALDTDGRTMETVTAVSGGFYPQGHRAVKAAMPQIIDVRLD